MEYTASRFGGVITMKGSPVGSSPANQDNSAKITVSVPGLVLLPAHPSLYTKTGGTTEHPGPPGSSIDTDHYGDPVFLRKITSITSDFKHYCLSHACSQALSRAIQNETVLINDISLPLGGGFDIHGDWTIPHKDHREGRAVDYNLINSPLGSNSNSEEARKLKRLISPKFWRG